MSVRMVLWEEVLLREGGRGVVRCEQIIGTLCTSWCDGDAQGTLSITFHREYQKTCYSN